MAWFADWLRIKGFTSGGPRCAHPQHLKDRPIYALANHDFRCTGNERSIIFANMRPYKVFYTLITGSANLNLYALPVTHTDFHNFCKLNSKTKQ